MAAPSGAANTNEISLLRPSHNHGGVRCPWLNREEWKAVYSWMYSKNRAQLRKAVGRVAVWKARACVPIPVDVTSDFVECFLWECEHAHEESTHQTLSLMYSMALTRFVNGVSDACKLNESWCSSSAPKRVEIIANVHEYAIPAWVVVLRHDGTHRSLPSLSALRSGAQFAMGWLKENYWKPQEQLLGIKREKRKKKHTRDSSIGQTLRHRGESSPQTSSSTQHKTIRLTGRHNKLFKVLTEANISTIAEHLRRQELLSLPPSVEYKVIVPSGTDLSNLPRLEFTKGSLGVWKGPLHNACLKDQSVKARLLSALIMAVHGTGCCEETRDYLAACLGQFLQEHQELETVQIKGMELLAAPSGKGETLSGSVDWMELLLVARANPGHYSYAIVKIILQHLDQLIPRETQEHILYLSTLASLSERIGHLTSVPPELAEVSRGKGESDVIVISSDDEDDVIVIDSDSSSSGSSEVCGGAADEEDVTLMTEGLGCGKGKFLGPPPAKKLRLQDERSLEGGRKWSDDSGRPLAREGSQTAGGSREKGDDTSRKEGKGACGIPGSSPGGQEKPPGRWGVVRDMHQWIYCPVGLCPGQVASPTFLDLPLEVDRLTLCDGSRTLNRFAEDHQEPMSPPMKPDRGDCDTSAVFNEAEITTIQDCIALF